MNFDFLTQLDFSSKSELAFSTLIESRPVIEATCRPSCRTCFGLFRSKGGGSLPIFCPLFPCRISRGAVDATLNRKKGALSHHAIPTATLDDPTIASRATSLSPFFLVESPLSSLWRSINYARTLPRRGRRGCTTSHAPET